MRGLPQRSRTLNPNVDARPTPTLTLGEPSVEPSSGTTISHAAASQAAFGRQGDDHMNTANTPVSIAAVTSIDGGLFPAPPPQPLTPDQLTNHCRQAWIAAYEGEHGRANPSIKKRAIGVIGQLAKDCEVDDDWRDLWRAAKHAGAAGRFAVVDYLVPTQQRHTSRNASYSEVLAYLEAQESAPESAPAALVSGESW